ncbi:putative aminopeptidase-2 [Phymastichus coffea]|uniref:putative aminopeptidase-2 n=1 Tax=Phymastichus coffea TaxID=108790 RepID=UPI00273C6320|nr:putative aminopeptidase-2 [Phymastichus coffea]
MSFDLSGIFRMDSKPNIFLTLYVLATFALIASAASHPTSFDNFQENEHSNNADSISKFNGNCNIIAMVEEDVQKIVLNAGDINVNVTSIRADGVEIGFTNFYINNKTETLVISLIESLKAESSIEISLSFDGKLRDDMVGFYKSSYYDEKGNQRWLASTQFESTHARHAFPCFDEPEFKAKFIINIQVPEGYSCLSNMDFQFDNKTNEYAFKKTPKMSTYLVAFVISDFKAYSTNDDNVKMWARPNAISQTVYSQKIGVKTLQAFSELFNVSYWKYMPKMDMVAVPDFSAGAMENWGLITYRETAGLYDEKHSSDITKQSVASVIVHECTHMWFGNLVTPEWWTYLWLSEAFARYYQYMGTDMIEKNWKMSEQFIVEQFQTAMVADSAEDSKPITRQDSDMITPIQIGTAGGIITYNKGASIVRMMEKTFGTKKFNEALKDYIRERQSKSATPNDLWQALEKHVNYSVAARMNTWTKQAGYPYITVTIESDRIKFRQNRFLLSENNSVQEYLWSVPITISSSSSPTNSTEPVFWLSKQEDNYTRDNTNDEWLIINVQSAGFYRVNYGNYWSKINKLLTSDNYNKILVENRAAIVDDLFNLARAQIINYELVFEGIEYLKREKQYLPFKSAFTNLDYLMRVTAGSDDYDVLKNYIMFLIKNIYNELTFDDKQNDDQLTILLRQELNTRACNFDESSCIKISRDYFDEWKNKLKPVPKNQRYVVYCTSIRHGTDKDWDFLYNEYKKTNVSAEGVIILSALGCSQDPIILKKYLLEALSGFETSRIRKQDISSVFRGVYTASLKNAEFMIDFANDNYKALHDYYKNYDMVGSLIKDALERYPIKKLLRKVEQIVEINNSHIKPNVESIMKSLKFVEQEINLFSKHLPPAIDLIKQSDPSIENTDAYRLPGNVIPSSYDIYLHPHISPEKKFMFNGKVKIVAKVQRSTKNITLHADQLSNFNITLSNITDKKNPIVLKFSNILPREKYNFIDIVMENLIIAETPISIEITYTGILNTEMRGFYRSSYKTVNGIRWLAATQMEPTSARRVFPCFDEPALKATFSISVQAPKNYSVISNTELTTKEDGLYKFKTTPPMSTYLVAVIVSDFKKKSFNDSHHKYSVYANPLVYNQINYALKVMVPMTQWFEKKLGHNYSLSKMDMIALPDFSSGAMENWGLLTYRETNLLSDPVRMSSLANIQSIRNVIAHEITHQWFGDLVSPHWWDYLWLNEGFARYFQCHAYTEKEADWKLETQFVVDHLQTSFSTDGKANTHPITHKVYSPTDIRAIFDSISYAKAASIIRMLEKLTGSKIFYNALNKYLEARKFDAAKPEDLFKAFQTEINNSQMMTKFNVTELMNSWTLQSGFPVLNVNFENDEMATITQTRFYLNSKKEDNSTWVIPLSWTTESNPNFEDTKKVTFLQDQTNTVKIKKSKNEWVILNLQQMGYFRVNYDENMWNLIIEALKSSKYTKIHEVNRANIVDDLLHLGRAGYISYDLVFSGLSYLTSETEYAPWKTTFTGLTYLTHRFAGHMDIYNVYRDFLLQLLEPIVKRLTFEDKYNDRSTDILLRHHALSWLCNFNHERCIEKALASFKKEKMSSDLESAVEPNKRSYVYCTAIKKGTTEDWNYLWKKFVNSNYAIEKMSALGALACSQDTQLLNILMDETIKQNSEIRLQDAKTVFSNIVNSGLVGVETVMDYIQNNYKKMKDYFGDDSIAKSTLTTISKRVSTDQLFKKFEELVQNSTLTMPELSNSLQSSLKRAKEEKNWFYENTPKIFKWLDTNSIKNQEKVDYRLLTSAKPKEYNIFLNTYFEENNFTFDGEVNIDIELDAPTLRVMLHSHDLNIKNISAASETKNYNVAYELHPSSQKLIIYFNESLNTAVTLNIKYEGVLRDDMRGFYRSSYIDEKNQTKWLASTHFEPTYARRAFPCFDEPSFKAYFTLQISIPKGYYVLSNVGLESSVPVMGGWTKNIFKKSLKMSPYLLAFIVSEYVETNKSGRVSVWTRPQLKKYMEYAPPVGEAALKFLENFTKIDYPLDKMNLVSIPDFDMGAMENWGLVTFREYGLTYSQDLTPATYKQYVNIVISHELVHQWFGNLITCEWWDYTWLNEGFAEYLAYLISSVSEHEWKFSEQFVIKELHVGLEFDSGESSHPMNNDVSTPSEAQDGFDKIAYQKSASVLRMLHHSFGEKVFVDAIHSYLDARKYDVARPEHFYKAIEDRMANETKKPGDLSVDITTVITSWTEHAGYPVVNANRTKDKVTLTQERFLISPIDKLKKNQTYWVPITYTTESEQNFINTEPKLWLANESKEITVPSKDNWFLINVQEIGFYRVNYNLENWQALINLLNSDNFKTIIEMNRAQIIDDLFNLARTNYIKYEVAFDASKYLAREMEYLPWSAYFTATSYISQRLEGNSNIKELYRKHVLAIIDNVYKKLGFKDDMAKDNHLKQLNRELITSWACKYGHEDCVKKAKNYYSEKSTVTPNVATAVYCTVVEHGDNTLWNDMWNKYVNALLATDYLAILKGLGCSKDANVLEKYLELIVEPKSKIRRQDAATAFSSVYTASSIGLNTTIKFFVNNLDKLYKFYGDWHDVGSLLTSLAGRISSQEHLKILDELSMDPKATDIKTSVTSAIRVARKNFAWLNNNEIYIRNWLEGNYVKPNSAYTQGAVLTSISIIQIIIFFV